jgi:hypothetical protein
MAPYRMSVVRRSRVRIATRMWKSSANAPSALINLSSGLVGAVIGAIAGFVGSVRQGCL